MYELLAKWGFDTLRGLAGDLTKNELSLTLEAVKTKNTLVVKRFEQAIDACDELIDLSLRIDNDLRELQRSTTTEPVDERYNFFLGTLRNELHPKYLREFRKLKGKYIVTNDLLAGYSLITTEIIQYRQFEFIKNASKCNKVSEAASLYRALWEHVVHTLTTLTRITANDVRFWLTDSPYMATAELFAAKELEFAREFFISKKHGYYRCILEDQKNLECFWLDSLEEIKNTYEQPSRTTEVMSGIMSL